MSVFVTDTHPLLWFTLNKRGNLSKNALEAFSAAEAEQGFIYIPAVVLWEAAVLERGSKIKLSGGFSRWAEALLKNPGFGLAPLEPGIIGLAVGYNFNNDPFDAVIVATAANLSLPLITKDAAITSSNLVEIHW
ncbi:MAG TPA: type II toxin-antitoxin system VapC family toxin [Pyrinomonadaceae bacterium]|nr:type II toxin-antitoxin system VapC family toxin [Pyrinomonadaceae bacterium]